jgi:ribosomal-protein-alanine N-acetyltransferase
MTSSSTLHAPIDPPQERLTDGNILLRLPTDADIEALIAHGDDPDVAHTIWVPIPSPCPRAIAEKRIAEFKKGWSTPSQFGPTLIIADAKTDEMIGILCLVKREAKAVEITYGVAPQWRRRSVATSAVKIATDWCLNKAGFNRVELRINAKNASSHQVAANAEFLRHGDVSSHVPATGCTYLDALYIKERA